MKYIVALLIGICSISSVWAQENVVPKFDGTKYYLLIYDEAGNEKVLSYDKNIPSWSDQITYSDFFDGSNSQLWVFNEQSENPGYIYVRNLDESLTDKHFLKSWSNLSYLEPQSGDREGNEQHDLELAFRFTNIFDDWYALETVDKPSDLNGMNYTPGPNALNFNANGTGSFQGLKTSEITPENAVGKVFKLVEFNPVALFESAIERGQELYENNPDVNPAVRTDLFYMLEKARETRVFGTDGEMLAFQPMLDQAMADFNNYMSLITVIDDVKAFIEESTADDDVKASFNEIVVNMEKFINSDSPDYTSIDSLQNNLAAAQNLVNAIVQAEIIAETLVDLVDESFSSGMRLSINSAKEVLANSSSDAAAFNASVAKLAAAQKLVETIIQAETFAESLVSLDDARFYSGMKLSIDAAKAVLANPTSDAAAFNTSIATMEKVEVLINETITANELIANTQEFDDAKQLLGGAVETALVFINTPVFTVEELDVAIKAIQDAITSFKKALEAGDTFVELINADFEKEFEKWNSTSDTNWLPYTENKGVDDSKNMTIWQGADYTFITSQSISGLPIGKYQISVMSVVSNEGSISLFANSGDSIVSQPLAFKEWSMTKRTLEIDVKDGTLEFGIKGSGVDNSIPANNWGTFDNFEVKWLSSIELVNPGFENEFEGWTSTSDTNWLPYTEDKGVDGSKNMTIWQGADYTFKNGQNLENLPNGTYQISVMSVVSNDSTIFLYGNGGEMIEEPLAFEDWTATKRKVTVKVTNGSLTFGIKGAGDTFTIPANNWGTFDNFEVVRLPDIGVVNPGFEEEFSGWTNISDTDWLPYTEDKGVDGSKNMTIWQSADYTFKSAQTINNLPNGTYQISVMSVVSNDGTIFFYGDGGELYEEALAFEDWSATKRQILANVTNGSLSFGIKGVGDSYSIPANNWGTFDNFEVMLKSITPDYVMVTPNTAKQVTADVDISELKNEIIYWQNNQQLNIRSSNIIVKYSVYSINGAMIEYKETRNNNLSIQMQRGIYIVKVLTENGFIDTEKISIR